LHGKNKIQNKQISVLSIKWCVQVVEIVEMDDEELYVSDDILEEASAARYQMLPKKITLTLSERNLRVNENQ
jgi:hypothetical protein